MAKNEMVSLFSGALGLDIGLEYAGFKPTVAVEKSNIAVETIKANRPKIHVFRESIEKVSSDSILKAAQVKKSEVCLVSGGPCCQSFSTVGNRGSLGDPRGSLFREFTRIVDETRPRFFIMENVKGILSAAVKHRTLNERGPGNPPLSSDEELGSALRVILDEFAKLGYYVIYGLLNCADYGVPQNRLRVIFLGSRDGEDIYLPRPTHSKTPVKGKLPWVSLREAIGNMNEKKPEYTPFPEDRLKFLRQLREGQNWTHLPEKYQEEALGAAFDSWGGRGGFCRRLKWDAPSPTLTTSPIGRATSLCHPTKLRPLSVREYAVLQQFPKEWEFKGSTQQKYTQIGNAVPVGLGIAIGKSLKSTMRKTAKFGIPKGASKRKGTVQCADNELENRLKTRRKTQLHPVRLLKSSDTKEIQEWLKSSTSGNE